MMTAPPYNGPQTGFSAGNWDNVTVLEYNCVTNTYETPTTSTTNTHVFAMNDNNDANGMDIADTDGDGLADDLLVFSWSSSSSDFRETVTNAIEDLIHTPLEDDLGHWESNTAAGWRGP